MEDFISNSANAFSTFLSEKEKELKNQVNPYIISYVLDTENTPEFFEQFEFITNFDLTFFYEKPDEQFSFSTIGNCLEFTENGSGRFAASVKKIKEWQNGLITNTQKFKNFVFPLFVGGAKFMVEHSDENWKDFSDSTWFVPDFLFLTKGVEKKVIINLTANPGNSAAGLSKKFDAKLQSLKSIKQNKENNNKVKLLSVFGDTPKDKKKWKQAVESSLQNIESGDIDKIVLSRKVEFLFSGEQSIIPLQKKLRDAYPNCYNFVFRRGSSYFFGATPERLAKFNKNEVVFEALAGSAPRGKNESEDIENKNEILLNNKNKNEHNFVVEHLKTKSENFVHNFTIPDEPSVKILPNIQHLSTEIKCELNGNISPLQLIDKLFPTPAICGAPGDKALQLIKKYETHQRGLYSGLIGWFNFEDEGEFVIAIRSALLTGKKLFAFAGCGIVKESDPLAEYSETELKLKPITSLFRQANENK